MNKKTNKKRGRRLFQGPTVSAMQATSFRKNRYTSPNKIENPVTVSAPTERTSVFERKGKLRLQRANAAGTARAPEMERTRAANLHKQKIEELEGIRVPRGGGRVGGRGGGRKKTRWDGILPIGFATREVSEVSHHYLPTKSLIENKSPTPAADPETIAPFIVRTHGNRRKLSMYEKMYPRTNFLIDSVSQTVGGASENTGRKFPLTSVSGFNRAAIFNPFGFYDACANVSLSSQTLFNKNLTYKMGHWTLDDFTQIVDQMIKKSGLDTTGTHSAGTAITDAASLMDNLKPHADGTTRFSIPITEMKTEYELQANSEFLCTHMVIYMVTPKKPVTRRRDPLWSFFRPFAKKLNANSSLSDMDTANTTLPDDMIYYPCVQSNPGVAITGDQASGTLTSNTWTAAPYISTLSTEIVREASLEDSPQFREDYHVLHQYRVCLQPQQMLKFSIISQINTMTDLFEVLGYDADRTNQNAVAMWPGKSVFPIIRFWGEERVASSIGLRRTARPSGTAGYPVTPGTTPEMQTYMGARNKLMDQTIAGPASCQLNLTIRKTAAGHFPSLPVSKSIADTLSGSSVASTSTASSPISWSFMDCVQQKNKNYYSFDAKERGETAPYHRINTNVFDFVDAAAGELEPYTGTLIPTVLELNTSLSGVTQGQDWPITNLEMGSTNDVNNVEIQVVTSKVSQETGSAI